jgi:hypothetical protein
MVACHPGRAMVGYALEGVAVTRNSIALKAARMPRTASSRVCRFIRRPCHIRGRCGEVQSAAAVWRRSPMPRSACRPRVSCPRKKRGVAGTADWLVPAMNPQRRLRAQRSEGPPLAIFGNWHHANLGQQRWCRGNAASRDVADLGNQLPLRYSCQPRLRS